MIIKNKIYDAKDLFYVANFYKINPTIFLAKACKMFLVFPLSKNIFTYYPTFLKSQHFFWSKQNLFLVL
jgi:hypothetical protein